MQGPVVRVTKRVSLRVAHFAAHEAASIWGVQERIKNSFGGRAGLSQPIPQTSYAPPRRRSLHLLRIVQSRHRKPGSGSGSHQHWSGFNRRRWSSPSSWPHRIDDVTMSRLVSVGLRQRGNTCKIMSASNTLGKVAEPEEWVETYFSNPRPHPLLSQSTPLGADSSSSPPCPRPVSQH